MTGETKMMDFATELDALLTKYKANGMELGEIIAELEGVLDGLKREEDDT